MVYSNEEAHDMLQVFLKQGHRLELKEFGGKNILTDFLILEKFFWDFLEKWELKASCNRITTKEEKFVEKWEMLNRQILVHPRYSNQMIPCEDEKQILA